MLPEFNYERLSEALPALHEKLYTSKKLLKEYLTQVEQIAKTLSGVQKQMHSPAISRVKHQPEEVPTEAVARFMTRLSGYTEQCVNRLQALVTETEKKRKDYSVRQHTEMVKFQSLQVTVAQREKLLFEAKQNLDKQQTRLQNIQETKRNQNDTKVLALQKEIDILQGQVKSAQEAKTNETISQMPILASLDYERARLISQTNMLFAEALIDYGNRIKEEAQILRFWSEELTPEQRVTKWVNTHQKAPSGDAFFDDFQQNFQQQNVEQQQPFQQQSFQHPYSFNGFA